jgi:putative sigma-54 modulation protein
MQIRTTARHFDLTDDLKNFTENEIEKLGRYFNHIIDTHLILDAEKSRMTAELKVKVYGTVLTSKVRSFDMYDSVEKVIDKMGGQLNRYKDKLTDKKAKKAQKVSLIKNKTQVSSIDDELEEGEGME